MKDKARNRLRTFLVFLTVVAAIASFSFWPRINLGFALMMLFVVGAGVYQYAASATKSELESFETWTRIILDEKRERLSDIENQLEDVQDSEYDISQDSSVPHSRNELMGKLKEEKKRVESRIEQLETAFLDAGEEIPEA